MRIFLVKIDFPIEQQPCFLVVRSVKQPPSSAVQRHNHNQTLRLGRRFLVVWLFVAVQTSCTDKGKEVIVPSFHHAGTVRCRNYGILTTKNRPDFA